MIVKELKPYVLDGRKWVYYQRPVFEIDEQEAELLGRGFGKPGEKIPARSGRILYSQPFYNTVNILILFCREGSCNNWIKE
ncbi:hypothetical protein [Sporotomaculum syntrophicum]|uniref:hypothetical protein n=1 Tax=Sporotomaculum syntrophicum TaxID=182264 RepID=UPI00311AA396